MNYLQVAEKVAKATFSKIKNSIHRKKFIFGAVSVRHDGSITVSNNICTKTPNKNAHAEKRVLAKAGMGSVLYLVRLRRDGTWGSAKPCKHCQQLIKNKKVRKVVYSISENNYGVWYPMK